ncbi:unnamed protein product [Zymoseptoria tritici ST99CH_3D7]|uniref:Uncharacterized protein n=1 Tax=Zymoseptoria tritici (strain ST99CH_3D7) TaxID=1276538 RepID=A0A1X7RSJ0_ZYMT9|nr:unnamed protein product [Zymoseptoria tritici ST99CH_3D7]
MKTHEWKCQILELETDERRTREFTLAHYRHSSLMRAHTWTAKHHARRDWTAWDLEQNKAAVYVEMSIKVASSSYTTYPAHYLSNLLFFVSFLAAFLTFSSSPAQPT